MSTLTDWLRTFVKILVKPTPQTFRSEAEKAPGKSYSAFFWLALIFPISHTYVYFRYQFVAFDPYELIIISLLFPIPFFFYPFCVNLLYKKLFNRKKDYQIELIYLMVSIFFTMLILSMLLTFIPPPIGNYLSWALMAYILLLNILALKALTNLKFWQSSVSVLLGTTIAIPGFIFIPLFLVNLVRALSGLGLGFP